MAIRFPLWKAGRMVAITKLKTPSGALHLYPARTKCFTGIISFIPHNGPQNQVLLLSSHYR